MKNNVSIKITVDKQNIDIPISSIFYVMMNGNNALFHMADDIVYQTRMTLAQIEPVLGDDFIKVKRGCLVSDRAIHNFTDTVNLINGERLEYAHRHRKDIISQFLKKQESIIHYFRESVSFGADEFLEHYKLFDTFPIAFCDIEMIFDDEYNAVDWIFRYANEALSNLEGVPLNELIGNRFSHLFPSMDVKWLKTYERVALFGETIKIVDFSPEINTYLDIICFPTFKGHCGCILFDIEKITPYRKSTEAEKAMVFFFKRLLKID